MPRTRKNNIASLYQVEEPVEEKKEDIPTRPPAPSQEDKLRELFEEHNSVKNALNAKIAELTEKLGKASSLEKVEKLEKQLEVALKKLEEYHASIEERKQRYEKNLDEIQNQVATGQVKMAVFRNPFSL